VIAWLSILGTWCRRLWRWRWPLALLIALSAYGLTLARLHALQREIAQRQMQWQAQALQHSERLRAAERASAERISRLAATAAQEQADAQHSLEDLRRQLRAGTLRLRERFACAVPAATGPAALAGGADGATGTGFTAADADLALGIAAAGDTAIRERNLAVAIAEQYRQTCAAGEGARP
jgi:hypothetical protein